MITQLLGMAGVMFTNAFIHALVEDMSSGAFTGRISQGRCYSLLMINLISLAFAFPSLYHAKEAVGFHLL